MTDQAAIAAASANSPAVLADDGAHLSPLVLLSVAGVHAVAIFAALKGFGLNVWVLGAIHVTALAVLAWIVVSVRRAGGDTSSGLLALLATAAVGPVGAAGAALLSIACRAPAGPSRLLERWYERISLSVAVDPESRLCDNVIVGRTINLGGAMPVSFPSVIDHGSISAQQAVLGLIARRFHPDYLAVLQSALKSPEPVVRVQAAAVAAHIRPDVGRRFNECVAELPAASADPATALAMLQRLELFIESGLLDEGDRLRGVEIANRLGDVVISGLRTRISLNRAGAIGGSDAQKETLDRLLAGRQRFAELRMARSADRAVGGRGKVRVRRLGASQHGVAVGLDGAAS